MLSAVALQRDFPGSDGALSFEFPPRSAGCFIQLSLRCLIETLSWAGSGWVSGLLRSKTRLLGLLGIESDSGYCNHDQVYFCATTPMNSMSNSRSQLASVWTVTAWQGERTLKSLVVSISSHPEIGYGTPRRAGSRGHVRGRQGSYF